MTSKQYETLWPECQIKSCSCCTVIGNLKKSILFRASCVLVGVAAMSSGEQGSLIAL